jgi:fatty acid CoA ligase FadD9
LKEHYASRLEALYDEIAAKQSGELEDLRKDGRHAPVFETLVRAVRATLGIEEFDTSNAISFADLGGDSLSALSLSLLLEEIYDLEIPVGVITNPAGSMRKLADYIEQARKSGAERPTFASVHGRDVSAVHAIDLSLEKFIDRATLDSASALPPVQATPARTVLLTGANGYLGRFLCLEWLERLARSGGRLVCIVRGTSAAEARQRLVEALDSGDADLLRRFELHAEKHLEVLAGDLAERNLGLDDDTWRGLAEEVDVIVHPAALVNHVLPYSQLFGPNVVGTAELIRLALSKKLKRFVNVSTVAVAFAGTGGPVDESADVRAAVPTRSLVETGYASGYATSKWAAEVLLREANARFGMPVTNFRSDMILAHSRYRGQLNVPDMFTRWIFSIVRTGLAPRSFYRAPTDRAHYDGLPVDFTAASVVALGEDATKGFHTYHVVNPHDDGISMDDFVEWIAASGHKVQHVDEYSDWFERFETALKALPEKQRHQSFLPLLHQLRHPMPATPGAAVDARLFHDSVRRIGVGEHADIPHLTPALITKYLSDLRAVGLLEDSRV